MVFFLRGIYSILHRGSFERTSRLIRDIAKDMPEHEKFYLNHKVINILWGVYLIAQSVLALLAGIGAELNIFWIVVLALICWFFVFFGGSKLVRRYIMK